MTEELKNHIYRLCRMCCKLNCYVSRYEAKRERVIKEILDIESLIGRILSEIED